MPDRQEWLRIDDLHAGYGGRKVLRGVSIALQEGEVAGLLGLNGSGKSTLLRAAMGLLRAHAGSVRICGEDMLAAQPRRRAQLAAYIPQRSQCEAGMTALEVVLMGANARTPLLASYTRADRKQALACLGQMGAEDWADRQIGTLSQGQQQLVLFARTMMQRAKLLMMDEPDGALDLPRRSDMMHRVRRMADAGGAALIALHDATLALNSCDRVLILMDGQIACEIDMRTAREEDVREAMRMLYGSVHTIHANGIWAVAADSDWTAKTDAEER